MEECIFCKIVRGEIPSAKVWEDDDFLAILDIRPVVEGMTVVLTKKHYDSYVFEMPDEVYQDFLLAAKKAAKVLKTGLKASRVLMVLEGLDVNHAHLKLYPLIRERALGIVLAEAHLAQTKTKEELEEVVKKIKNNLEKGE